MKKTLLGVVAFMFASILCIPGAFAADDTFGTVEEWSGADSYKGDVKPTPQGSGTANVSITYDELNLQYVPTNEDGRDIVAAWIGVKLIAPQTINSKEAAQNVKIRYSDDNGATWPKNTTLYDSKDSEGDTGPYFIGLYSPVTEEAIADAAKAGKETLLVRTWEIDWDNNGTYEQTIRVYVNPMNVTLADVDNSEIFTPEDAAELAKPDTPKPVTPTPQETTKDTAKLDDMPKTGSTLPYALLGFMSLVLGASVYTYAYAETKK